jgi:hypothetical protein
MVVAIRILKYQCVRVVVAGPKHRESYLYVANVTTPIAFWNSIQLTSESEKSCQMAVPPSRTLLFAGLPVSGRARVRVMMRKITAFRLQSAA